ncbi:MAG: TQO small subunit DoxD [Sporichthyaceae bacterium]
MEHLDTGTASRVVVAGVRIAVALMWIQNVNWKRPPDFGRDADRGLYKFTNDAVLHPVVAPFSWFVERVVLPNFTLFGYATLLLEFSLGAFLLAGLLTRLWAVIGIVQTAAITMSVLNAPNEWQWSYYLMFAAHFVLLASAAGRVAGLDAILRPRWRRSGSRLAALALKAS